MSRCNVLIASPGHSLKPERDLVCGSVGPQRAGTIGSHSRKAQVRGSSRGIGATGKWGRYSRRQRRGRAKGAACLTYRLRCGQGDGRPEEERQHDCGCQRKWPTAPPLISPWKSRIPAGVVQRHSGNPPHDRFPRPLRVEPAWTPNLIVDDKRRRSRQRLDRRAIQPRHDDKGGTRGTI